MDDATRAYVDALVAAAPPPTEAQIRQLARIFFPASDDTDEVPTDQAA